MIGERSLPLTVPGTGLRSRLHTHLGPQHTLIFHVLEFELVRSHKEMICIVLKINPIPISSGLTTHSLLSDIGLALAVMLNISDWCC